MKLHHVGYLVANINDACSEISKIMEVRECSKIYYDNEQAAYVKFITCDDFMGAPCIEFVQPNSNNKSLLKQLEKKGDHIYHLCYITKSIDHDISSLVNEGAILVKEKKKAIAFNGKEVAFLFIRSGFLIELVQE